MGDRAANCIGAPASCTCIEMCRLRFNEIAALIIDQIVMRRVMYIPRLSKEVQVLARDIGVPPGELFFVVNDFLVRNGQTPIPFLE